MLKVLLLALLCAFAALSDEIPQNNLLPQFVPFSVLSSKKHDGEWQVKVHAWGGLTAEKLSLAASQIAMVELDAAARTTPMNIRLEFTCEDEKGDTCSAFAMADLPIDGQFHTLQFPVADFLQWKGTVKKLVIRCISNEPVEVMFRNLKFLEKRNLIAGAELLTPDEPCSITMLWPRGHYRLSWVGEENPGVSLTMSDREQHLLDSVELKANSLLPIEFTVHDMAVANTLTIKEKGKGWPLLELLEWKPPHTPEGGWNGSWIWCQNSPGPEQTSVWFQKQIKLNSDIDEALIMLAVDDSFDLFVNGNFVGHGYPFTSTFRYDIAQFLKKGDNTILLRAFNGATWGGTLIDGFVTAGTQHVSLASDDSYEFSIGAKEKPGETWQKAIVLGPPLVTPPWGQRTETRYIGPMGEMAILDNSTPGVFTARVKKLPPKRRERIMVKALAPSGKSAEYDLKVRYEPENYTIGDVVKVHYAMLPPMPQTQKLIGADDYMCFSGKDEVLGVLPAFDKATPPLSKAHVCDADTLPHLMVNGKRMPPIFWQEDLRNVNTIHSQVVGDDFAVGGNIFLIQVVANESMPEGKPLDFSKFERRLALVLAESPNAYLMVNAYLNMPEWWLKAHPDSRGRNEAGKPVFPNYDTALGSLEWREAACQFLREFIAYVKKQPWADRIIGVTFCESNNGEWFWEVSSSLGQCGHSPSDIQSFRLFLARKYKSNEALQKAWAQEDITLETVPMLPSAVAQTASCGTLLDPTKDQRIIDFFEWRNVIFAEQIIAFGKAVKEATDGRWLTGAYYGYALECACNGSRTIQDHGHNGFMEVAQSPYIDYVRGISRYILRKHGAPDGLMVLADTFKLRGKLVWVEQDFRSYSTSDVDAQYGRFKYPYDTIGSLNRTLGMTLATGTSEYFLDLTHAFYEPCIREAAKPHFQILQSLPSVKGLTPCECAIVASKESAYYTKRNSHDTVMNAATSYITGHFNRTAIPYRYLTLEDLEEDGLVPPLKFYVMTAPVVMTAQQRQKLLERFEREKATVVWLYAAGPTYPSRTPDTKANGDFLGLQFELEMKPQSMSMIYGEGKVWAPVNSCSPWFYPTGGFDEVLGKDASDGRPVLVRKHLRGATHYFATQLSLPVELLAELAENAGVHRYNKDATDQWWIGNDYLTIYAVTSGEKKVTLPPNTQMTAILGSVKGIVNNGDSFFMPAGQTAIFHVENLKH